MLDVTKAIKILEPHSNTMLFGDKDDIFTMGDIVEYLKTQKPVEPKKLLCKSEFGYEWIFYCGRNECGVKLDRFDVYCHHCGHAVKWT